MTFEPVDRLYVLDVRVNVAVKLQQRLRAPRFCRRPRVDVRLR